MKKDLFGLTTVQGRVHHGGEAKATGGGCSRSHCIPPSEQRVRNVCVQHFTLYTIQNPDPENSAANFQYVFSYINKSN